MRCHAFIETAMYSTQTCMHWLPGKNRLDLHFFSSLTANTTQSIFFRRFAYLNQPCAGNAVVEELTLRINVNGECP